ncbi:type IV pilin-like G/H family protein [Leptolyngbya sp. CCY15150]|uniref:type IV pilin-like G/H family protein n=1 Tax=Leptolyngbya sp. CCY15150 TaxID=2767772 RepID=UPI001952416B|nr:type IV pilin-like G/H family protein [Leptolyngbya sp. CCY15150]
MTTFHNRLLLQVLRRRSGQSGFTLIELLVVIIIIGILAAIALPSFLNQANKARQSEAQTYIGAMNRAQQAFYLENREFADQAGFADLELGISNTENYTYTINGGGAGSVQATNEATPSGPDLKGYAGTIWLGTGGDGNATTLAKLCEGDPGAVPACDPD